MSNILMVSGAKSAEIRQFEWPVACELGISCWLMNYLDTDEVEGTARDYTCAGRTYDGHTGTDIAIRSGKEMKGGIATLSIAEGTVSRLRSSEKDAFSTPEEFEEIREAKKECGNGILIDHGDGWLSQYCHLKQNSALVKPGDKIIAGQPIAQIGMSGITEHPHLHVVIYHKGKIIDPYTGLDSAQSCDIKGIHAPMWKSGKYHPYQQLALYDGGFTAAQPDFDKITQEGSGDVITATSPAIVFWGGMLGMRTGDEIALTLRDPEGAILAEQKIEAPKDRARQFYYIGKKLTGREWPKGDYKGTLVVKRKGTPPIEEKLERVVTIK